nr:hypothetical protein BAR15_160027 [Bartonella sp. AR 15-3]
MLLFFNSLSEPMLVHTSIPGFSKDYLSMKGTNNDVDSTMYMNIQLRAK